MADAIRTSQNIIVEGPVEEEQEGPKLPSEEIVSWVMGNVQPWRQIRDTEHKPKWDHWFAVWMGIWKSNMKTRNSERSRIVSPGSQMAVDLTVAEIVEGTFSRTLFFGLDDEASDEERQRAQISRSRLAQDLYEAGIVGAYTEAVQNGALYGTGILKIAMDVDIERKPMRKPVLDADGQETGKTELVVDEEEVVSFSPVAIEPGQFVPDPSSNDIDKMLGCAHEFRMPLHTIQARQRSGVFYSFEEVSPAPSGTEPESSTTERRTTPMDHHNNQWANITEWHGKVPAHLIGALQLQRNGDVSAALLGLPDTGEMVESIVTIANDGQLLRAIPNPMIMKDRAIVAWQHDKVPNSFWGRGVMQKGHNVQAATDAEMRARVDHLAWSANPMLAVKASALVPGQNMNIWPGKVWALREDTNNTLKEFKFGEINGSSFNQTAELATWMSQATGTVDTVGARQNVRDEATGAAAIQQSGFLKRARHTMYNIEEAMTRFIRRTLWRKMQYDPDRYDMDFEFKVAGTAGMMAREMQQQQHISTLQFLEQGSPEQLMVLKKIFEHSTADDKAELIPILEQRMQGPSEEEKEMAKQAKQLEMEAVQADIAKKRAETQESQAKTFKLAMDAGVSEAKEGLIRVQTQTEQDSLVMDIGQLAVDQAEIENHSRQLDLSERGLDQKDRQLDIQERGLNQSKSE